MYSIGKAIFGTYFVFPDSIANNSKMLIVSFASYLEDFKIYIFGASSSFRNPKKKIMPFYHNVIQ